MGRGQAGSAVNPFELDEIERVAIPGASVLNAQLEEWTLDLTTALNDWICNGDSSRASRLLDDRRFRAAMLDKKLWDATELANQIVLTAYQARDFDSYHQLYRRILVPAGASEVSWNFGRFPTSSTLHLFRSRADSDPFCGLTPSSGEKAIRPSLRGSGIDAESVCLNCVKVMGQATSGETSETNAAIAEELDFDPRSDDESRHELAEGIVLLQTLMVMKQESEEKGFLAEAQEAICSSQIERSARQRAIHLATLSFRSVLNELFEPLYDCYDNLGKLNAEGEFLQELLKEVYYHPGMDKAFTNMLDNDLTFVITAILDATRFGQEDDSLKARGKLLGALLARSETPGFVLKPPLPVELQMKVGKMAGESKTVLAQMIRERFDQI